MRFRTHAHQYADYISNAMSMPRKLNLAIEQWKSWSYI
ncbi:MAG: hypothetical protein HPY66_2688 [Firmicutes bacterium]|nr:hypothetical protein [Bacillota bacterium]